MRHFIAYHNTEKIGQPLCDGNPLRLITTRRIQHLLHNAVWFVQGDGTAPKSYSLGSVFVVAEVGETTEAKFSLFAEGQGHVFQPPVPLNELEWFKSLFKAVAHFSLGVQELKEERFVEGLIQLASQAGYRLPQENEEAGP